MIVKLKAGRHGQYRVGDTFEVPDGHKGFTDWPERYEVVQEITGEPKAPPPDGAEQPQTATDAVEASSPLPVPPSKPTRRRKDV